MTASLIYRGARGLLTALAVILGACATGPQAPSIRLELAAREVPGSEMRWQQADPAAAGVRVWRGSQELRVSAGMLLQLGDIVETGPTAAAVIRFRPAGTTVLDTGTRVRIGSLEVFFGRVFANVRGFFQTSSDTVLAGVSGTRFLFQVRPGDRATRVEVLDGEVTCTPKSGQGGWPAIRLRSSEGLIVGYGPRGGVQRFQADPRELRDAEAWANQVSHAAVEGWCCAAPGQLVRTWNNRCGSGRFSSERGLAEAMCRPAAVDPVGYCCNDGAVQRASRSQCWSPTSWYDSEAAARRACQYRSPPPPPPPSPGRVETRPPPPAQPAPPPRPIPTPAPVPPAPRPPVIR